jgi:hypothetical protein
MLNPQSSPFAGRIEVVVEVPFLPVPAWPHQRGELARARRERI